MDAAEELVKIASTRGITVATAESCTAGMIASAIADVPGASAVLRGGAITYCDEIKRDVLGVRGETLAACTAVSVQTAREMAERARELFAADVAMSATGYAGPGGGTAKDPAGTVYLGVSDARGTECQRFHFTGDRNDVRAQATRCALEMLLERTRIL